ncbi:Hypothetical protein NTJ_05952 [Nesidiocoris tenuis]|uniref:Uncharacterized protein n=1 Tax=Nesidiocoris tenuis TaxID=355587 RepID=A0ABN7AMG8_9HEMI|nr:Hypothetical protein NTJ_05952 [Nesidiocoris tenuis]
MADLTTILENMKRAERDNSSVRRQSTRLGYFCKFRQYGIERNNPPEEAGISWIDRSFFSLIVFAYLF